ncbi:UL7 tegument protein [Eptesicus fuscus gammaherpesvirus]|uniref:UL7 tegument protein n=1 Tax=vespertilionid gammaherpesvirus 3 TaxID=2846598 RepID=A0A2D0ZXC1_9GAMA|nr:UL7 tegument protein [Eptesicus fuscus gammaherpesvirus]ATA58271.1 UL7 tegument protein [Eptesicus fuscus gammaherpesvirus]WAH70915.1 putative virion egress protein UL7 [Eptesicus fuscus gammaherpesvirus]
MEEHRESGPDTNPPSNPAVAEEDERNGVTGEPGDVTAKDLHDTRQNNEEPAPAGARGGSGAANEPVSVYRSNPPVIPRLVLEVNVNGGVHVACNTPNFLSCDGRLQVRNISAYVRAKATSPTFLGFTVSCVAEFEDHVTRLDLYPHVLRARTRLLHPRTLSEMELCALLSMVENLPESPMCALREIRERGRALYRKCASKDACFLLHGLETLLATHAAYYKLDPAGTRELGTPLVLYKLHRELDRADSECKGLLKSIYLQSTKMAALVNKQGLSDREILEDEESGQLPMNTSRDNKSAFNLFYSETVFTIHLQCREVVRVLKEVCLRKIVVPSLFLHYK